MGDEPSSFDWAGLVPRVVHPLRVAIIETLWSLGRPMSASQLREVFDHEFGLSLIAYHIEELVKTGVIEKVSTQQVRGATQTFYFFPKS